MNIVIIQSARVFSCLVHTTLGTNCILAPAKWIAFRYDCRLLLNGGNCVFTPAKWSCLIVLPVQLWFCLLSDGGRVCRPLLVVENGRTRLTKTHLDQMALAVLSLQGEPRKLSAWLYGCTSLNRCTVYIAVAWFCTRRNNVKNASRPPLRIPPVSVP